MTWNRYFVRVRDIEESKFIFKTVVKLYILINWANISCVNSHVFQMTSFFENINQLLLFNCKMLDKYVILNFMHNMSESVPYKFDVLFEPKDTKNFSIS